MDVNKSGPGFSFLSGLAGLVLLVASVPVKAESLWNDVAIDYLSDSSAAHLGDVTVAARNETTTIHSGHDEIFRHARYLRLDEIGMRRQLLDSGSPAEKVSDIAARSSADIASGLKESQPAPLELALPLPDGRVINVSFLPDTVLPDQLAAKFPEIRTYRLLPDETILSGRIDMTPQGFHASLQLLEGEVIYIDPLNLQTEAEQQLMARASLADAEGVGLYASYRKRDQQIDPNRAHRCKLHENEAEHHAGLSLTENILSANDLHGQGEPILMSKLQSKASSRTSEELLQYRVAIAATGEYTQLKGGSKEAALGAIATAINRINQVYEQDLGIHLVLVENNDQIIFTDPGSDPYESGNLDQMLIMNQEVINSRIGNQNYDVGHLFATSGGGLARIGSACNASSKAMGISATGNPGNDAFYLDFVAHELGHQFGATHTFNSSEGLCAGRTRTSQTAYEPGSGSTIMSYAGICGTDNIQSHVDAMFHIGSIDQIRDFTRNGSGKSCGLRYDDQNLPPLPSAGKSYTIPANTPFQLEGSATDPDGDRLVYGWEQIDAGTTSAQYEDKGDNALFRVHMPSRSSTRTFPPLHNILSHTTPRGENLPVLDRVMRFRFVAQDGINPAQSDEMSITVKRTGSRFALNLPRTHYTLGSDYRLNWNRANTDKAPIHCDTVDIHLSTDGGYHYDLVLAERVPNTGEAWVYLAASLPETSRGRFRLSCSDNVFFAISYRDFRLTLDDIGEAAEPGPEPDLEDKAAGTYNPQPSELPVVESSGTSASGGGNLNPYLLAALLLLTALRRRLR